MSDGYSMTVNGTDVYVGSGNVYEDLGLDDADELFAKAALAHRINMIIKQRGWTQATGALRVFSTGQCGDEGHAVEHPEGQRQTQPQCRADEQPRR